MKAVVDGISDPMENESFKEVQQATGTAGFDCAVTVPLLCHKGDIQGVRLILNEPKIDSDLELGGGLESAMNQGDLSINQAERAGFLYKKYIIFHNSIKNNNLMIFFWHI